MTIADIHDKVVAEREYDAQRVRLLYRQVPRSVAVNALIGMMTVAVIAREVDQLSTYLWFAAILLVCAGRLVLLFFYRRAATSEAKPLAWENGAAIGAGLMGLTWAVLALIGPSTPLMQLFIVFVFGGMSFGSTGILGASIRGFASFNVPVQIAQIGSLFYIGGSTFNTLGAMSTVFTAALIMSFIAFRSALLASIRIQADTLHKNREQRLIFESVTAGIVIIHDRKITDHNQHFAQLLGYDSGELIGKPTRAYFANDMDWQQIGAEGYAALRRGESYHLEYAFRTKSGGTITCEATMRNIVAGKPELGIVAILNDITLLKEREYALRAALLKHLAIFSNAPAGILLTRNRQIEECNEEFARMLRAPVEGIVGQTAEWWYGSRERWELRGREVYGAFSRGESIKYTEEFVRSDGTRFWCRVRGSSIDSKDPIEGAAVFVMVDVTEQSLAELALRESQEQMALVVSAAQSGIWDLNMTNQEIAFSPRFFEILGYPPDTPTEELALPMRLVHVEEQKLVKVAFYAHITKRISINSVFRMRRLDGSFVWVRGQGQAQWDEHGRATRFVGSITDISEIRKQEDEIRRLALEDPLTCLPNRRLFEDRLSRAISTAARNQEQVAVLLLDLDGFKDVNDEHGHAAGDAVLVAVAVRLKAALRESDTVARTGGDEFVLVVRGSLQPSDVAQLAEKLLAAVREPIIDAGITMHVGSSIGIAMYPEDSLHSSQLVRLADIAMYEVKQSGRNGFRRSSGRSKPPAIV